MPPLSQEQTLGLPDGLQRFPSDFAWGSATAAYQIEGGAKEGGRGPSIWDTFSHIPGNTLGNETGDVADDHYHRYDEDIALMKSLGLKHYRMSLSWSRLLPTGRGSTFNPAGLAFYTAVFESLNKSGISPLVTVYHWDIPQTLEDEYGGWRGEAVVDDFAAFADMAFKHFSPWVKSWTTFNEALTFIGEGYGDGVHAPGRCSDRSRCAEGDSNWEPILVAHNVILAHAAAVAKFRERFPPSNSGGYEIGMVNCGFMTYPYRESDAERSQEFLEAEWAWFLDPVIFGDYPESLKKRVGDQMPSFTPEQSEMLKNSVDFIGVNYYTSRWVAIPDEHREPSPTASGLPYLNSRFTVMFLDDDMNLIGPVTGCEWLFVVPEGIHDLLVWLSDRYNGQMDPPLYDLRVTENGLAIPWWDQLTLSDTLNDTFRVDYYKSHIEQVGRAITEGVKVTAYYAWSLMDNYEWADGYSKRFGLIYVDYETQERIPKLSAWWYSALIDAHATTHRDIDASRPSQLATKYDTAAKSSSSNILGVLTPLAALFFVATVLVRKRRLATSPSGRNNVELPDITLPNVMPSVVKQTRYQRIP